jgi:hypothetical protein
MVKMVVVVYDILRKKEEEKKNKNNGGFFIQCPMPSLIIERVPSDCIGDRKDRNEYRDPHFHYT